VSSVSFVKSVEPGPIFSVRGMPNVFTRKRAAGLIRAIFACPEAKTLLNSSRIVKPLLIDVDPELSSGVTEVDFGSDGIPFAIIWISEKFLGTTSALKLLAFEIFNAQHSSLKKYKAKMGDIGMDSYARQLEELEYANTFPSYALIRKCGKAWQLSEKELEENEQSELHHSQPEVHFFMQETSCHTDHYRRQWIDEYQKIYCKKHPEDSRSCEAKMTDFCELNAFRSMPLLEQIEIVLENTCKAFPEAHATVKNDPGILNSVSKKCPEVLEKEPSFLERAWEYIAKKLDL
jgi:hypothetical protein